MRNIIKQVLKEEVDLRFERIKSIVNKYGIKQATEVLGGVEIIKNAYQDNPLEFLNQFNDLIPVKKDYFMYYVDKDKIPLFKYDISPKSVVVYINYDRIWMFFDDVMGLKTHEIQEIISNWLKETYNIKGLTPFWGKAGFQYPLHIYPNDNTFGWDI